MSPRSVSRPENPPPGGILRALPSRPPLHRPEPEPLWRTALGERLRRIRHERGERLADVAGRAGLSPQYLSEVERGVKDPSSEVVAALAGALGVSVVDLTAMTVIDLGHGRGLPGRTGQGSTGVATAGPVALAA